jgi:hypothetical protein
VANNAENNAAEPTNGPERAAPINLIESKFCIRPPTKVRAPCPRKRRYASGGRALKSSIANIRAKSINGTRLATDEIKVAGKGLNLFIPILANIAALPNPIAATSAKTIANKDIYLSTLECSSD